MFVCLHYNQLQKPHSHVFYYTGDHVGGFVLISFCVEPIDFMGKCTNVSLDCLLCLIQGHPGIARGACSRAICSHLLGVLVIHGYLNKLLQTLVAYNNIIMHHL